MSVAITFCAQTKRERCDYESSDSFFRWSEAEFLPHFIEPEAQALFQLTKVFKVNAEIDRVPRPNQNRVLIAHR